MIMRRVGGARATAAALLVLGAFVLVEAQVEQPRATIEGIVVDSGTMQPIPDVIVTLSPAQRAVMVNPSDVLGVLPQAVTNSQGYFSIQANQAGRFRVVPQKNGFVSYRPGATHPVGLPGVWVQLTAETHIEGLMLKMARPAVISGSIVNAAGQPATLPGVFAYLMRYTYGDDGKRKLDMVPGIYGPGASARPANDRGEFRLYDLPPGEYYVGVSRGEVSGLITPGGLLFYPGVTDETKAVPVQVNSGDEINLGALQLPAQQKDVQITLRVRELGPGLRAQVTMGDRGFSVGSDAVVFRIAPGHYDISAITKYPPQQAGRSAAVSIDVGAADTVQELVLKPAIVVGGKMTIEKANGQRSEAPPSIVCSLGRSGPNCLKAQVAPGSYGMFFQGLPADTYVLSAKANGRNIFIEGLSVTNDTELEIILAEQGGVVDGVVRTAAGEILPDASVVLIPEPALRATALLYRSVITDPNGKFEIRGIAPGSYKLFAWSELEGEPYHDTEFMKEFDDRGEPLAAEKASRRSMDLVAF